MLMMIDTAKTSKISGIGISILQKVIIDTGKITRDSGSRMEIVALIRTKDLNMIMKDRNLVDLLP